MEGKNEQTVYIGSHFCNFDIKSVAMQIKDWLVFIAYFHRETAWAGLFGLRRMSSVAMLI